MWIVAALAFLHFALATILTVCFWRPRRICDWPIVISLAAFGSFYLAPILLGWISGYFNSWTVGAATAFDAALAAGLFLRARRHPDAELRDKFQHALRRTTLVEAALWLPSLLLLGATLIIGTRLPIRSWDAVEYDAPAAMRWGDDGHFSIDSFGDPRISGYAACSETYPNAKAVLPALILAATGREDGTALAQWPFVVLAVAAMAGIGRRLGLPRWALPLAALAVLSAPEVLLQSVEAYADVAFLAGQLVAVWSVFRLWQDGYSARGIGMAALAFALVASSKPTGYPTCLALGVALAGTVAWRTTEKARQGAAPSPEGHRLNALAVRRTSISILVVGAAAILSAGPWFFHALFRFANPVYPLRVTLGAHAILQGVLDSDINNVWSRTYMGATGLRGWWRILTERDRSPTLASWTGGLGAHTLIFGMPALAALLAATFTWPPLRRRAMPLVVLFGLLLATTPAALVPRLILFEAAAVAVAAAWLLAVSPWALRVVLGTGFVALIGYDLMRTAPSVLYRIRPPEMVAFDLLSGHTRSAMTDSFPDEYSPLDFWREEVAGPGRMLALPPDGPVWLARPLANGASVVRAPSFDASAPGGAPHWAATLRTLGATHLYAPRATPAFSAAMASPRDFRLLMHRIDSGAESSLNVSPREEAGLFEILPSPGAAASR